MDVDPWVRILGAAGVLLAFFLLYDYMTRKE